VHCIQNKNILNVVVAPTAGTSANCLHTKYWYTRYGRVNRMECILMIKKQNVSGLKKSELKGYQLPDNKWHI